MSKQETLTIEQARAQGLLPADALKLPGAGGGRGNARPRHRPGVMNKTEQRMDWELSLLRTAGEIRYYSFESIKLKLAKKTWFTVDFWIIWKDGTIEAREVKGHWEDDARVKIKVAAEMYRH